MSKPSRANVELRKQQQTSEQNIAGLNRQHAADVATIDSLQEKGGTVPTLSQERLAQLFTAHGIKLNRLTGGADLDPTKPGDEALKVYVVPIDDDNQPIKAAGSFTVEAISTSSDKAFQQWTFSTEQARQSWLGSGLLYEFVLTCPFAKPAPTNSIQLKVTFTDELTQRRFFAEKKVSVKAG